ncbi:hypothetical protein CONLIGDRAFT_628667 [Coniochaeta ligniaria NRRL 30616]|uniref:Xaa-Pro aminopeptidase n=1 Tax=Coniochaeta ligniaria NRRL 30616 TaxID=1408157 RepID=A0A1J7JWH3_9PEZI|nr:hypothetical protein CONLIGDRAFT_628667 [Coniochaeta ligniaria NRRL 30616]
MDRLARYESGSSACTHDDVLSDTSESLDERTEFNHDLVLVDEFDALSIELKGHAADRPTVASVQDAAAATLAAQAAPSAAQRLSDANRTSFELLKHAPKLGKYPAQEHARKVAKELGVLKGLIYLPGQISQHYEDSDQGPSFHQRRYFYYITGADFANCEVTYDIGRDNLILWIPWVEPRQALYFGSPPSPDDIKSRSDLSDVRYTSELPRYLRTYLASSANPSRCHGAPTPTTIFILHRNQVPPIDYDHAAGVVCLDSTHLQPSMDAARVIKTQYEIAAIKHANAVSSAAHRSVLSRLKRMTNEREIEAFFRGYCLAVGAKHQAYPVIVGSGSNAATLHYDANDEPLAGRQLIVLDAGCEWLLYASDVTRTLPIGGALTPEARAVYAIVERMQEQCIAAVRPGVPYYRLHLMAALIATQGLLKLGVLTGGTADEIFAKGTAAAFFPHGLGHHVGLDVHDVSGREALMLGAAFAPAGARKRGSAGKREWITPEMMAMLGRDGQTIRAPYKGRQRLAEGMVVTIEPGIYFSRPYIETLFLDHPTHSRYIDRDVLEKYYPVGGVRIEDDILVTYNGYENLTTAPKGEEAFKIINGDES